MTDEFLMWFTFFYIYVLFWDVLALILNQKNTAWIET